MTTDEYLSPSIQRPQSTGYKVLRLVDTGSNRYETHYIPVVMWLLRNGGEVVAATSLPAFGTPIPWAWEIAVV